MKSKDKIKIAGYIPAVIILDKSLKFNFFKLTIFWVIPEVN